MLILYATLLQFPRLLSFSSYSKYHVVSPRSLVGKVIASRSEIALSRWPPTTNYRVPCTISITLINWPLWINIHQLTFGRTWMFGFCKCMCMVYVTRAHAHIHPRGSSHQLTILIFHVQIHKRMTWLVARISHIYNRPLQYKASTDNYIFIFPSY